MRIDHRRSYRRMITLKFLLESQWLTADKVKELQLMGLKELIKHAKKTTKYYRNYGDIPEELDDLRYYPVLTKEDIKTCQNELTAKDIAFRRQWTAGTSQQVTILKNKDGKFLRAGKNRFDSWFIARGKEACIWAELKYKKPTEVTRLPPIKKVLFMPIINLADKKSALKYLKLLEKFKPVQLRGYTTSLSMLAYYALKHNVVIPSVKVVITNCEPVFKEIRIQIQQAFRCPLYNFYGSRDLGCMAQDCEQHRGLHLFAEKYILEITKDGRFLWTDLLNYAMPLIRYENGDMGEFGSRCTCGRGLPMIKEIIGRKHCWLLLSNGRWLHSIEVNDFILKRYVSYHRMIYPYQIRQEKQGKATFLIWIKKDESLPKFERLIEHFRKLGLEIKVEAMESVPRYGKSRKTLTAISKFMPPWEVLR